MTAYAQLPERLARAYERGYDLGVNRAEEAGLASAYAAAAGALPLAWPQGLSVSVDFWGAYHLAMASGSGRTVLSVRS